MKHLFRVLLMIIPIVGYSQNIIPDDSTNVALVDVARYYDTKMMVRVGNTDCPVISLEKDSDQNKFFREMVIEVSNGNHLKIGYYNYLAVINRCNIANIYELLKSEKLRIIQDKNELKLSCSVCN